MKELLAYLTLPSKITDFEAGYLRRINSYATRFLVLNIPLLATVAALNKTGPLLALVTSALIAGGPVIAQRALTNPRNVSRVFALAAIGMGGLLVHFGQGPMQIEMHFYFFVLIALLSVFGNPSVILVAAATTALHHLVVYLLFPTSVFNYKASVWVVLVHALFVVVESVASCFVARSFFDNVIGLERIVAQRTSELAEKSRDVKLMLDNAGQGFLRVMLDGSSPKERSAILEQWLGACLPGELVSDYFARTDKSVGQWLRIGLEAIQDDFLPLEGSLSQLPTQMVAGDLTLSLRYRPIEEQGKVTSLLVIVSDITAELARAAAEADNRDIVAVFERIVKDRAAFVEFMTEAQALVEAVTRGDAARTDVLRYVHTLKGNSLLVGMSSFARVCHELESRMDETGELPSAAERASFDDRWRAVTARIETLLGNRVSPIELSEEDSVSLSAAVSSGKPRLEVLQLIDDLKLEPAKRRLERVAEDARSVATRLGKDLSVEISSANIRLSAARWAPLWSSVIHVVRNALDHGIEAPEERVRAGKPAGGNLTLSASFDGPELVIGFCDDGRGIDWAHIKALAERRGLPSASAQDLQMALFADGVSTKEAVSEYSGRGVGMSAVLAAVTELEGHIRVQSELGRGTLVELRFPRTVVHAPCREGIVRTMSGQVHAILAKASQPAPALSVSIA
jgi:HPt (histidine-containing phosphotransfer) domain-containing protein